MNFESLPLLICSTILEYGAATTKGIVGTITFLGTPCTPGTCKNPSHWDKGNRSLPFFGWKCILHEFSFHLEHAKKGWLALVRVLACFQNLLRPSLLQKFEQQKQFWQTDLLVTFVFAVLIVKPDNSVNQDSQLENVWSSQHGIFVFNKTGFSISVFSRSLLRCNVMIPSMNECLRRGRGRPRFVMHLLTTTSSVDRGAPAPALVVY